MAGETAGLVRERMFPDQASRRHDFAIDELGPHDLAVGAAHRTVISAADAQIHCGGDDDRTFRPEPFLHPLRLGEAFPNKSGRRVEYARDDEIARLALGQHDRPSPIISCQPCATRTIQFTPNLSATMPNRGEKKVLPSGIRTSPPWARAENFLSASASSLAAIDSAKPSNFGLPVLRPSDDMIVVSPT